MPAASIPSRGFATTGESVKRRRRRTQSRRPDPPVRQLSFDAGRDSPPQSDAYTQGRDAQSLPEHEIPELHSAALSLLESPARVAAAQRSTSTRQHCAACLAISAPSSAHCAAARPAGRPERPAWLHSLAPAPPVSSACQPAAGGLPSPRFVNAAQQSGIHQPVPERIDYCKVRLRPGTDGEDVDRPEKLITIRCWLQSPNEERVNCRIPDLTDRLHRVDVQDRKGSVEGARFNDRLPPIRVAEPS